MNRNHGPSEELVTLMKPRRQAVADGDLNDPIRTIHQEKPRNGTVLRSSRLLRINDMSRRLAEGIASARRGGGGRQAVGRERVPFRDGLRGRGLIRAITAENGRSDLAAPDAEEQPHAE
jgi:hypothetical protein